MRITVGWLSGAKPLAIEPSAIEPSAIKSLSDKEPSAIKSLQR
jgi:hypothetical protein